MKIVDQDVKWEAAFKSGRQIEQSLVENPVGMHYIGVVKGLRF